MKTFWVLDLSVSDLWDYAMPVRAETPQDASRAVPSAWRTSEGLRDSESLQLSRDHLPQRSTLWKRSKVLVAESKDGAGARAFTLAVSVRVAFDVEEALSE